MLIWRAASRVEIIEIVRSSSGGWEISADMDLPVKRELQGALRLGGPSAFDTADQHGDNVQERHHAHAGQSASHQQYTVQQQHYMWQQQHCIEHCSLFSQSPNTLGLFAAMSTVPNSTTPAFPTALSSATTEIAEESPNEDDWSRSNGMDWNFFTTVVGLPIVWSCAACTYDNPNEMGLACEVCGTERTQPSRETEERQPEHVFRGATTTLTIDHTFF